MQGPLIASLAFMGVFSLFLALFLHRRAAAAEHARLSHRLRALTEAPAAQVTIVHQTHFSAIAILDELLSRLSASRAIALLIRRAGLKAKVGEVVLAMAVLGSIAAVAAWVGSGSILGSFAAAAIMGPGLSLYYLAILARSRRRSFARQLPDALEMIKSSLQAGHSFGQALELVAQESPEPTAGEFRQVLEELRLGRPLKQALAQLYERIPVSDLRFFNLAVLIQREVGGNLSEILDAVARTLRERFRLQGQVRAVTAQGRAAATMLTLLTPGLAVVMSVLNHSYLAPLFTTHVGRYLIGYAGASILVGYAFMRRIVNLRAVRIG